MCALLDPRSRCGSKGVLGELASAMLVLILRVAQDVGPYVIMVRSFCTLMDITMSRGTTYETGKTKNCFFNVLRTNCVACSVTHPKEILGPV